MKNWYLTIAILLFGATGSFSQSVLEVDENTFYFGAVPQFSNVYHHYWFRSVGEDTVIIDSINTGCSCAILDAENLRIAPGDSALVTMKWDVGRKMNMLGQNTKIYYNRNPRPKNIGLRALVKIKPEDHLPLSVVPFRFEFGHVPASGLDVDSIGFRIYNDKDHEVSIRVISQPIDGLEIALPELIEPKSEGFGFARLRPEYKEKEFDCSVTFEMSDEAKSRFTVPVRRKIYR